MDLTALYYENCLQKEFNAQVLSCQKGETGWEVTLDRSAFYPGGGGQACDTGTLEGIPVTGCFERENQTVHICREPLPVGQQVTGLLDWERRFAAMQQHTGEHILSGLIFAALGYHNVGFHMGKNAMEVDFDGPIDPALLEKLERRANEIVWENLPVKTWWPEPEVLDTVPYRSKRKLNYPVRIVEIPGVDTCACCGVHTATTGQVGLIKILSCVKFHQGVRLEMVCGSQAYDCMEVVFQQNRGISQLLSAQMPHTLSAVEQLADTAEKNRYRINQLEKEIFSCIAASYQGRGNAVHFGDNLSGGALRDLAEAIGAVCGGVAAVVAGDGESWQVCLRGESVKDIGTALMEALGGRGGGKNGFFQGKVSGSREQVEEALRGIIE